MKRMLEIMRSSASIETVRCLVLFTAESCRHDWDDKLFRSELNKLNLLVGVAFGRPETINDAGPDAELSQIVEKAGAAAGALRDQQVH